VSPEMTSLERVRAALEHREADRVPFDLGGSILTGIHERAYVRLRQHLGLPPVTPVIEDCIQGLARVDEDVRDRLGVDVRGINPGLPAGATLAVEDIGAYERLVDEWGIEWHRPKPDGLYFDMRGHPLANIASVEELDRLFRYPDPEDRTRYHGMAEAARRIMREERSAYILGRNAPGVFEIALWTRGFAPFFRDMLSNPSLAGALLDRVTEVKMRYWEIILEAVDRDVLVVSEADDLSTQSGPMISPALYRKMVKPRHARLFGHIRRIARAKVHIFYHSCGAIRAFMPDLIEVGVDILNPVQVSAEGMDSGGLKRDFGADVTFWGGGVDTQAVLPKGTPAQVREEVRRRVDDFAPGGGFVFAAVHNIQADVPPQNIMAMWEAYRECADY